MKFVILQTVPYRTPEGALAQYHGATLAEELKRRGHDATKMVLGDPSAIRPESPVLSLSTQSQREDPAFWNELGADVVLCYDASPSEKWLRVLRAVKSGSPRTRLVVRIEGMWTPKRRSVRASLRSFPAVYVAKRHCPTELFDFEIRNPVSAAAHAVATIARSFLKNPSAVFADIVASSDETLLYFPALVDHAKKYFRTIGRPELAEKIACGGFPVRPEFLPPTDGTKDPCSVISIANWRHFKDPELTADAMAAVLRKNLRATYTVIGLRSDRVASRILSAVPEAASRVRAFDHVDNWNLPQLLAKKQVFLLCSHREGTASVLAEALCCGCSLALAPSLATGCFRHYLRFGDGTLASSRSPEAVASAIHGELGKWERNERLASAIADRWRPFRVSSMCDRLTARPGCREFGSGNEPAEPPRQN